MEIRNTANIRGNVIFDSGVLHPTITGRGTDLVLGMGSGGQAFLIDINNNSLLGPGSALATGATDGFIYVPSCAGTPAGTPTTITGGVPLVVDTTNKILYFYATSWNKAQGAIKSIQQISITLAVTTGTSGTAAISSVDTTKSYVVCNGQNNDTAAADPRDYLCTLVLTNATTVTATRNRASTTGITIKGTVVEFL